MLELAIYVMSIAVSEIFLNYNYDIFFKMVTYDSLFSAIYNIKNLINQNLTESQIIQKSYTLYEASLLDRFLYYVVCQLAYTLIKRFFWMNNIKIIYYGLLLSIVPPIINKILNSKLVQALKKRKEEYIKNVIAKIMSYLTTVYAKIYLDRDISVKYTEFLYILKDYKETLEYALEIVKNCVVILTLAYVKKYSIKMYYTIIKYIYNYKTGEFLETYNNNTAKKYLINIIDNKKWAELKKPNTCKAIIYLYQNNYEETDLIKKILNSFNFTLIKMFAVWTFSSLVENIYIIPIISFFVTICRKYLNKINYDQALQELSIEVFSGILSLWYPNYILISVVCHYGSIVLYNKGSLTLIKMLIENIKLLCNHIFQNNEEWLLSYFVTILYLITLKFLEIRNMYLIIVLNILTISIMSVDLQKQIIFGLLLLSTYFSNYNFLHVLHNFIILFFFTGILDKYTFLNIKHQTTTIVKNNLKIDTIIANYDLIKKFVNEIIQTIKNLLIKIYIFLKKRKSKEEHRRQLVFDLMDTDKFPSMISNLNKQNLDDSVSLDDDIFNKPDDAFINEISIDDNNDDSEYKIIQTIKNPSDYNIIDNFLN